MLSARPNLGCPTAALGGVEHDNPTSEKTEPRTVSPIPHIIPACQFTSTRL
jgi:hypothetical protein